MVSVDGAGNHRSSRLLRAVYDAADGRGKLPLVPHPSDILGLSTAFSPTIHRFSTGHPEASVEMSPLILSRNASSALIRAPILSQA